MNRAQFSNLPLPIDKALLAPPQAISDKTLCDMHPVNILKRQSLLKYVLEFSNLYHLFVDTDNQGKGITNFDIFSNQPFRCFTIEYPHWWRGHSSSSCEGSGAKRATKIYGKYGFYGNICKRYSYYSIQFPKFS